MWNKINGFTSHLNWYDLFRKTYPNDLRAGDEESFGETEINGVKHKYRRGKTVQEYTPWLPHVQGDHLFGVSLTDYIGLNLISK